MYHTFSGVIRIWYMYDTCMLHTKSEFPIIFGDFWAGKSTSNALCVPHWNCGDVQHRPSIVSSRTAPMNFTRLTCGFSVAMKLVFASINFKSFLLLPSVDRINTDCFRFINIYHITRHDQKTSWLVTYTERFSNNFWCYQILINDPCVTFSLKQI